MRRKRIFWIIIIILAVAIIGSIIFISHLSRKAIPDYNDKTKLASLTDTVMVYRDDYAIPHVYAASELDLYRTVGYVMAQDRLWQMDLLRRATMGRLSEIFGDDLLETDYLMRSLRITQKSKTVLEKTDTTIIKALEAYSDGVNQYIAEHTNNLPPEFSILSYTPEKWKPLHSANLIGFMAWDLAMAWHSETILYKLAQKLGKENIKELIPDIKKQKHLVFPGYKLSDSLQNINYTKHADYLEICTTNEYKIRAHLIEKCKKLEELGVIVFGGSNNWAVDSEKSENGKPMLANDMHLGLFAPGLWYQMHQVCDGKVNVTGLVLPGQPFVIAGHNEKIAWGMTNVMLDDMDFYVETINPRNPNQYQLNGKWKDLTVYDETFRTSDGQLKKKQIKATHRGVIISDFKKLDKQAVSMKWIGNTYSNELRSVYLLNRAKNWNEFRDAMRTFVAISQNLAYADVDGNIGLQTCAGIPIRAGNPLQVYPGDTDKYDWQGIVPFEKLPYSYNPARGHVSSANNKTVDDNYPYHISHWFDLPYRINRIREMLQSKDKLSVADFKNIQTDFQSKLVLKYKDQWIEAIKKAPELSSTEKNALNMLHQWDGIVTRTNTAASIFDFIYYTLLHNIAADEMGDSLYNEFAGSKILVRNTIKNMMANQASNWWDNVNTPQKEAQNQIIIQSFRDAIDSLHTKIGDKPLNWQWGKIHQLTMKHPLGKVKILDVLFNFNRGPFPMDGSFHTIAPYAYTIGDVCDINHGASHRHIYTLHNWDESLTVIPTGTSGIPASKHYCDQTELYINNQYHRDLFSQKAVIENARYISVFY